MSLSEFQEKIGNMPTIHGSKAQTRIIVREELDSTMTIQIYENVKNGYINEDSYEEKIEEEIIGHMWVNKKGFITGFQTNYRYDEQIKFLHSLMGFKIAIDS